MRMSEEAMAAFELETRLLRNPNVTARREAYYASLGADRSMLAALPRETLAKAIADRRLWTLPEAFEQKTSADMVEAIARCMQGKERPSWLGALGLYQNGQR